MYIFITFFITYLICAINPAIIISKKIKGTDIRNLGSKNAGTTNSLRTMGKFWGAVVFFCDILKVVISYFLCLLIVYIFKQDMSITIKSAYILGAVIGHCYPIYYGFKGGKGMVCVLIACLIITPQLTLICLGLAIIVILITKMVSLASVLAVVIYTILTIILQTGYTISIIIVAAIIVFKHKENIKRIIQGKENKIFNGTTK
jgi:acyl phosphate:glycerol-3-phosphate acyltransferase